MGFDTQAIHAGEEPDFDGHPSGDVVVPIHLASTFARRDVDEPTGGFEYSRSGNPTRCALEKKLAAIENARYGLAFSSGLGAETTLCLSLLRAGDHIVSFDDIYGGTRRLFTRIFQENYGIDFTYVDARDPEKVKRRSGRIRVLSGSNRQRIPCSGSAISGQLPVSRTMPGLGSWWTIPLQARISSSRSDLGRTS